MGETILCLIAIAVGFALGKGVSRQEKGIVRPSMPYDRHRVLFK